MNDEIKEILDNIKNKYEDYYVQDIVSGNDLKQLLDLITNLQQELQEANDSVEWWSNRFKAVERDNRELKQDNEKIGKLWREEAHCILLQQENEELKKKLDRRYYKNEYERIKQENERLKDIVVEKDNQIKEMILQKTDYTAINILEMKLEDYKSRCEKAIPMLKELNQCIKDILDIGIDIKNISDIEDLLQNGSEEK